MTTQRGASAISTTSAPLRGSETAVSTGAAKLDVARIRQDFPILGLTVGDHPLVYLDNAATSQKPVQTLSAIDDFYRTSNANVHRGVHTLSQRATRLFDETRESVRKLLNARESAEVIFTKGCTEGINFVAQSYARPLLKAGDEILVSTMEHHSNIVPWQLVAEQTGAVVRAIPVTDSGDIDLAEFDRHLTERTKIVAIVHVSNSLGTINPVKEIVRRAHETGALVLVDGAQAGPHLRIDVQDLDADFYTLSCHKLYAPTGLGVLFGKRELLDAMPPYQGGGDMIDVVSFGKTTFAALPAKFEAGTPNVEAVVGLGASIAYLETLGGGSLDTAFDSIGAYEADLTVYGADRLREIDGLNLVGTARHKAGILSFTMDCAHPHDIGTVLDSRGIAIRTGHHCCMPLMKRLGLAATARASLAFYNTREEIDALVEGIHLVKETFE